MEGPKFTSPNTNPDDPSFKPFLGELNPDLRVKLNFAEKRSQTMEPSIGKPVTLTSPASIVAANDEHFGEEDKRAA